MIKVLSKLPKGASAPKTTNKHDGFVLVSDVKENKDNGKIFNYEGIEDLGYRIDNFCYLTDVKTIPNQELNKLKNIDLLVLSCLRIDEHPNHLNLKEAEVLINKLKPKRCYLTHISHLMGFHEIVNKKLAKNVFLAYDTLRIKSH